MKLAIEKLNKSEFETKRRTFYSLCRNVKEYEIQNNDVVNETIEKIKNLYPYDLNGDYYKNIIKCLTNLIFDKKISPNDAIIILLHSIDPEFKMYSIYEECCNIKNIKSKINGIFRFYDENFLKHEMKYLKQKGLEDKYKWEYKKMD